MHKLAIIKDRLITLSVLQVIQETYFLVIIAAGIDNADECGPKSSSYLQASYIYGKHPSLTRTL